jgi:regulation of enolase protein 1 (concanavalin A-like superfamily)
VQLVETFGQPTLPTPFSWLNPPARYRLGEGLEVWTDAETDFWQTTHYGFQRDDGHCLLARLPGDFCLLTQVEFRPRTQYDQCGLMVRVDSQNWIKVSTEYEDEATSRLGSVVTNLGYSDWATQDVDSNRSEMWYRISKNGPDFMLEHSTDGQSWQQMRVTHLHKLSEPLQAGVYACSPIGAAFWCRFKLLQVSENQWS